MVNRFLVDISSSFKGTRCYSDTSKSPDLHGNNTVREAGIDIFIINTDIQLAVSMFLKATMQVFSSVLMVEAAALALAATLLNRMSFHNVHLFSDNQLLVNYINGPDSPSPLDWRIKPYSQIIISTLPSTCRVYKIRRTQK
jgi:hypothetical protein